MKQVRLEALKLAVVIDKNDTIGTAIKFEDYITNGAKVVTLPPSATLTLSKKSGK
jgi:hypothetical protein|tara:strand:- start:803 stop:967 length:165 start_codon:yes stop_codon:yes gene_type:complete